MLTKEQKIKQVEEGLEEFKKSEVLIFTDFTGVSVNNLNSFRVSVRELGASFRVFRKRLLKIIFQNLKLDFNPEEFEGQTGVISSSKDLPEFAGIVYKFSKEHEDFKILGGFDLKQKKFIEGSEIEMIGRLPSREVLLAQLVGTIAAPIRSFLYILSEKAKKVA